MGADRGIAYTKDTGPFLVEREILYIFSSHLRADQMCRGSFLGTHQFVRELVGPSCLAPA